MSLEARIGADQPGDGEKLHCSDVAEHVTHFSSETDLHILIKHRYAFEHKHLFCCLLCGFEGLLFL